MPNQDKQVMTGLLVLLVLLVGGEYFLVTRVSLPSNEHLYYFYGKALSLYANTGKFMRLGVALVYPLLFVIPGDLTLKENTTNAPEKKMPHLLLILLGVAFYGGITFLMYRAHLFPVLYQFLLPAAMICLLPIGYVVGSWLKEVTRKKYIILSPTKKKVNDLSFNIPLDSGWINIPDPSRHTACIGASGAGKTYSISEPIIKQLVRKRYTGAIFDWKFPKQTNYAYTYYRCTRTDVKFYVVNFMDLSRSHRVNPISPRYITTPAFAEECAESMLKNLAGEGEVKTDFWYKSCRAVLTAFIWFLRSEYPQYCYLPHIVTLLVRYSPAQLIGVLQQNDVAAAYLSSVATATDNKASDQLAGVIGSLQVDIARLYSEEMFWILSGEDFTLDLNNPLDPKLLCIGTQQMGHSAYSPVIGLIFTVASNLMNQPDKRHSVFKIDEFNQINIPNFNRTAETCRENKIALVILFQELNMIQGKYGQNVADSILGNMNYEIYGKCGVPKTANYISEKMGPHEVPTYSKSTGSGSIFSTASHSRNQITQSLKEVKRITPYQVQSLPRGVFVGKTVENDVPTFHGKVQLKRSIFNRFKIKPIPAFSQNVDIKANYLRILSECEEIMS